LTDGETGISGQTIGVELIPVTGTGSFTTTGAGITSVQTGESGGALFDQLNISGPYPGTYRLKFSGGGASVTSGTFTMDPPPIIP
jgi:hypothetical protein